MNAAARIDTASAVALTATGRPNRRDLAKARTRVRVLDAARFLFINVGYQAATVRDVAARAGMSTGAVFSVVTDKAQLYREAMGAPPPNLDLADEIGLILAQRPGWRWLLRFDGNRCLAHLSSPDYNPTVNNGQTYHGTGDSPATALREARLQAERLDADRGQA